MAATVFTEKEREYKSSSSDVAEMLDWWKDQCMVDHDTKFVPALIYGEEICGFISCDLQATPQAAAKIIVRHNKVRWTRCGIVMIDDKRHARLMKDWQKYLPNPLPSPFDYEVWQGAYGYYFVHEKRYAYRIAVCKTYDEAKQILEQRMKMAAADLSPTGIARTIYYDLKFGVEQYEKAARERMGEGGYWGQAEELRRQMKDAGDYYYSLVG